MGKSLHIKRFVVGVLSFLYPLLLLAQRQYDYMDDNAVAGGADRALNAFIIIILLIVALLVFVFLANAFFNIYYWFNPEANPEYKRKKRREELEKAKPSNVKIEPSIPKKTSPDIPKVAKEIPSYSDQGYNDYVASFDLTIKPESKDRLTDIYTYKMYDGDKLISTTNGAGINKLRKYDINPKMGTKIICDDAYDDYDRPFESTVINIPHTVIAIGNNAFKRLYLPEITLPSSLKYITGNPFGYRCMKVNCPNSRFSFENGLLQSREQSLLIADLSDINKIKEIPQGIKYIGREAYKFQNVQFLNISSSVIAIAAYAFSRNDIWVMVFNGKTEIIDESVFSGSPNLKVIYIPQNTLDHYKKVIPQDYYSLLVEKDLDNVSFIELIHQFIRDEDSKSFSSLNMSLGGEIVVPLQNQKYIKKDIEEYAITQVEAKDWSNAIIDWGSKEDEDHDELDEGDAQYSLDGKKFLRFDNESGLEEYVIRKGVEIICDNAICDSNIIKLPPTVKVLGNRSFDSLENGTFLIPKSVKTITGNPFVNCSGEITCNSPYFIFENGVLYDKKKRKLVSVLWSNDINEQDRLIDTQIIMIGRYAFYRKTVNDDKPLVLPPNVLYIGESAFRSSSINVVFSNTIIEIADAAFASSKIKSINLPPSLSILGKEAFYNCASLKSITLSPRMKTIEEETFCGCSNLKTVYIPEGVKILKQRCFYACTSLREVRFPNSLEKIERYAFDLCPLAFVVVSRNTIIEEDAFPSSCEILYRDSI